MLGGIILITVLIVFVLTGASKERGQINQSDNPKSNQSTDFIPTPAISFQLQQAIDEAKQSAREYDDWHSYLRQTYPWLRKLPVSSEKYYVYFDLYQEKFIGSLYPKAGDNVNKIKAEALRILKEVKEIPVESYQFHWSVSPQSP